MEASEGQPTEHLARVIPFPTHPRGSLRDTRNEDRVASCFICVHGQVTSTGTRCVLYSELIDSEFTVAADCDTYEDDPTKE